jgi:hypothetical protein
MNTQIIFTYAFQATAVLVLLSYVPSHLFNIIPFNDHINRVIGFHGFAIAVWLAVFLFQLGRSSSKANQGAQEAKASVYGLQHGRLHLQTPTPMWMNMGYWKVSMDLQQ